MTRYTKVALMVFAWTILLLMFSFKSHAFNFFYTGSNISVTSSSGWYLGFNLGYNSYGNGFYPYYGYGLGYGYYSRRYFPASTTPRLSFRQDAALHKKILAELNSKVALRLDKNPQKQNIEIYKKQILSEEENLKSFERTELPNIQKNKSLDLKTTPKETVISKDQSVTINYY